MNLMTDLWSIFNAAKRNSETVVWQDSIIGSNQRPPKPYITLKVIGIQQLGHTEDINTGQIKSDKLSLKQESQHVITINCQYISDSHDSIFKAEELRSYVQTDDMNVYISKRESNIALLRVENCIDTSTLIQDAYENRSSFDVFMNAKITREELVEFIEQINMDYEIEVSENDIIVGDIEINL